MIEIWQPKWKDRTVLVDIRKVRNGVNQLFFSKTPTMPGIYTFNGMKVKEQCDIVSNGKIKCYAIPLGWLHHVEDDDQMVLEER